MEIDPKKQHKKNNFSQKSVDNTHSKPRSSHEEILTENTLNNDMNNTIDTNKRNINNHDPDGLDELILRATNPKQIGIFSSGGLSNKIVDEIQNSHSRVFQKTKFETIFKTFNGNQSQGVGLIDNEQISTNDNQKLKDQTNKIRSLKQTDLTGYDIEHRLETDNLTTDNNADDGLIFEPDVESESDEELPDPTIPQVPEKTLSFKERAIRVFYDIKKKLGLVNRSEKVTQTQPVVEDDLPESSTNLPGLELIARDEHNKTKLDDINLNSEPHDKVDHSNIDTQQKTNLKEAKTIEQFEKTENIIDKVEVYGNVKDNDLLFIITYLDDETDLNNLFLILEHTRKLHIFTVVIASLPRYFGKVDNVRLMNKSLQKLRLQAEMVLLLPYFNYLDSSLIPDLIKELMELITEPGLINVDVADLSIIIKGGNVGVISFGIGHQVNRVKEAFEETINSKLLNVELAGVQKALLNVTGGQDMTIGEVEAIAEQIKNRIKSDARLILGARVNSEWNNRIKLFLMLGVTPMQVMVNRYANE